MEHYASAQQVYAAGLVFARVAAMLMVMPALGEATIPARVRTGMALVIAICVFPIASPHLPPMPQDTGGIEFLLIREILIGLLIGAVLRMMISALAVAGEVVSLQTTLSFAQTANPMEAQPTGSVSTFLSIMGLALIFATNLHHVFLGAIFGSYTIPAFQPGHDLMLGDAVSLAVMTCGKAFALGIQMAAPVIVFGLVFNIASGLIGRLMPQFQIYFVASPLSVIFGLSIFALSLGTIGMLWIQRYRELTASFTGSL